MPAILLSPPVETLDEIVARLRAHADALRSMGLEAVTVFGSFAEGRSERHSDVDIMIEPPGAVRSIRQLLDLSDEFEGMLMRDVDIVIPGPEADKGLIAAIRASGTRVAL